MRISLTLDKLSIIQDFNSQTSNFFYSKLSLIKNRFLIYGFFFIYNDIKHSFETFLRQYPIEIESFWQYLETDYLVIYGYYENEEPFTTYFKSQRFYQTLNNLDPIFYMPFNWQSRDLVFSTAVRTATTFSDNNTYQAFSIAKNNVMSFVTENAEVVYANPTYAFIDGVRANTPITLAGTTCNLTLPLPASNKANPFTILIMYSDVKLSQIQLQTRTLVGNFNVVVDQVYNNQNYLGTPDDQIPLTFYLPHPYFSNNSGPIILTFLSAGAIIYKCFLAELPVIGNSILFNPNASDNSENYICEVVARDLLTQGLFFDGVNYVPQADAFTYETTAQKRITNTSDYFKPLPLGPNLSARYTSVLSQTKFTNPFIPLSQGMVTRFNFSQESLQKYDFVALPSNDAYVHVKASIGKFFLSGKRPYASIKSDFPIDKNVNWASIGNPDVATGFNETQTTTEYLFTTSFFYQETDIMNYFNTVTSAGVLLSYRNNQDIKYKFDMSSLDTFTTGLRTDVININHYVGMRIPSVMTLNFYNLAISADTSQTFKLSGLNPVLLQAMKYINCRVSFNRGDYLMDQDKILTGRIETDLLKFSNDNQNVYEPIAYFNGIASISCWRPLTTLNASAEYHYKIILDSAILSNTASLNVQFFLA